MGRSPHTDWEAFARPGVQAGPVNTNDRPEILLEHSAILKETSAKLSILKSLSS
jgi:hypothetical protein